MEGEVMTTEAGIGDEARAKGHQWLGATQNEEKLRVDSSPQASQGAWPANILILGF